MVHHCRFQAKDYSKDGRRRADVLVTDSESARTYDFVVTNAAAPSAPDTALREAGAAANASVKLKDRKYTQKFKGVRPGVNFFACAAESHGTLHNLFFTVLRELVDNKYSESQAVPKSVLASRLYERIGVALQKGNAQGILSFRYTEIDVPEGDNAKQDAVMGALYTGLLSLADCDADLASAADGTQVAEAAPLAAVVQALPEPDTGNEIERTSEQGGPEELESVLRMSGAMAPDGSGSDSEKEDLVGSVTSTSGTGSMSEESGSDMRRSVDPLKVGVYSWANRHARVASSGSSSSISGPGDLSGGR